MTSYPLDRPLPWCAGLFNGIPPQPLPEAPLEPQEPTGGQETATHWDYPDDESEQK
jgi:hypothetical protein